MKIYKEQSLSYFDFWGNARENVKKLTCDDLDQIEYILEDIHPEGVDEIMLNDIFSFDFEWVCECLGISEEDNEQ